MYSLHLQSRRLYLLHKHIPDNWKKLLTPPQSNLQTCPSHAMLDSEEATDPPVKSLIMPSHSLTRTPLESSIDSLLLSIKNHSYQNQLSEAFKAFSILQHHPSFSSFCALNPLFSLLVCCTKLDSLSQGKQLHALILSLGFENDPLLIPKLVNFYLVVGHLSAAHAIVENSNSINVLPWNFLISAYVRHGICREALLTYKQMVKRGVKPDSFTYPSVLKACGDEVDLDFGREVLRSVSSSGLGWNVFVQNAVIGMYVKWGLLGEAQSLFESMPERDVVSWNTIISGYASKGQWDEAFKLFERMQESGAEMNSVTWNTIAGGNVQTGNYAEALKLISHMTATGGFLDSVAMVIGLTVSARTGSIKNGKEIHGLAVRRGCVGEESVKNALITMYCQCKHLSQAFVLFCLVGAQNVVTWNCMISGYANLDWSEEASFVFREMISSGFLPNYVTIASILPLCARIANLQHGKELHCYITKHNFEEYLLIWNALVDMYSKSGRIFEAQRVFDSMAERDKVTYTSLIAGYGVQGKGQIALKLFNEMIKLRIKPDHITIVAVLSACSHSGLVTCGRMIFEKMVSLYEVKPRLEHYACMVDLYGRAGLLKKAEEILLRMPFQPSPAMWATLIGACQIHRNMEIGAWAAQKLLEIRPQNPGYYVLIANMYAAAGHWSKLAEVRICMRDLGLRKDPGCTWVGVGNEYHPFLVGDSTNARAVEVYLLLEELGKHMSDDDYLSTEDLTLEAQTVG
ncbi:pentatricopeptide repeat-containing protein At1g71490 [Aristolochia californica]|uniref:pentatricopeptide repeat-containing protein At1g71490 n=1 Tax=Aristolochia californica TaxID=171875 RepID=UPI0035D77063